jgi:hypothetical protein
MTVSKLQLTDWLSHVPAEGRHQKLCSSYANTVIYSTVIAKNFGTSVPYYYYFFAAHLIMEHNRDIESWANIPAEELYIFPASKPKSTACLSNQCLNTIL